MTEEEFQASLRRINLEEVDEEWRRMIADGWFIRHLTCRGCKIVLDRLHTNQLGTSDEHKFDVKCVVAKNHFCSDCWPYLFGKKGNPKRGVKKLYRGCVTRHRGYFKWHWDKFDLLASIIIISKIKSTKNVHQ